MSAWLVGRGDFVKKLYSVRLGFWNRIFEELGSIVLYKSRNWIKTSALPFPPLLYAKFVQPFLSVLALFFCFAHLRSNWLFPPASYHLEMDAVI